MDWHKVVKAALLGLLAVILIAVGVAVGAGAVSAQSQNSGPYHAQAIVDKYLGILNAGMASNTCDFSALSTVYAPDARLTLTGGPFSSNLPPVFGPRGSFDDRQYDGIDAITAFYTNFCALLHHGPGVARWTQVAGSLLAPNVLLSYERVSFSASPQVGRCAHSFTIQGDKIASLDWSVYE